MGNYSSIVATKFECATTTITGQVGIKVLDDQSNSNFEIKSFAITELSQIELPLTEDVVDETITISDLAGTGGYVGFDINERDAGMWIDGFIRPDPDTDEAINDRTSDFESAYQSGAELLKTDVKTPIPAIENWNEVLDSALPALDQLRPVDKGKLVKALIATVMADNKIVVAEMELLRVVCAMIHVPLPMITGGETT